ncbi:hydrophobic surface binding protein A-domain-containing protein, partial [Coniella lustricola]
LFAQPLLALAALAAPSLLKRDLQTIQSGITAVQTSLDNLGTAVDAVSATDPTTLTKVLSASQAAQDTIANTTTSIQGTTALSLTDALTLQQSATGLTTSANKTVTSLIAKKPVFDQLGVSTVVGQQLVAQKKGASALGNAIVSKVPAIGQSIAQQSIGQINTVLDQAITAYGATGTAATNTGAGTAKSNSTAPATAAA